MLTRFGWLQPRLACVEFHEPLPPPCLSEWPSCADGPGTGAVPGAGGVTFALLVQLLQVWSAASVYARPSGWLSNATQT